MVRKQAVALVLVSFWVAWTLFMWFAATRSFRTAGQLLRSPDTSFAQVIKPLGESSARAILHYAASQINTVYFRFYGLIQIALGVAVLLLLWWKRPPNKVDLTLAGGMLLLVLVLAIFVEPRIAALSPSLDLNPNPGLMPRFWMLHGAYTGLDAVKLVAGVVLIIRWIWAI